MQSSSQSPAWKIVCNLFADDISRTNFFESANCSWLDTENEDANFETQQVTFWISFAFVICFSESPLSFKKQLQSASIYHAVDTSKKRRKKLKR